MVFSRRGARRRRRSSAARSKRRRQHDRRGLSGRDGPGDPTCSFRALPHAEPMWWLRSAGVAAVLDWCGATPSASTPGRARSPCAATGEHQRVVGALAKQGKRVVRLRAATRSFSGAAQVSRPDERGVAFRWCRASPQPPAAPYIPASRSPTATTPSRWCSGHLRTARSTHWRRWCSRIDGGLLYGAARRSICEQLIKHGWVRHPGACPAGYATRRRVYIGICGRCRGSSNTPAVKAPTLIIVGSRAPHERPVVRRSRLIRFRSWPWSTFFSQSVFHRQYCGLDARVQAELARIAFVQPPCRRAEGAGDHLVVRPSATCARISSSRG